MSVLDHHVHVVVVGPPEAGHGGDHLGVLPETGGRVLQVAADGDLATDQLLGGRLADLPLRLSEAVVDVRQGGLDLVAGDLGHCFVLGWCVHCTMLQVSCTGSVVAAVAGDTVVHAEPGLVAGTGARFGLRAAPATGDRLDLEVGVARPHLGVGLGPTEAGQDPGIEVLGGDPEAGRALLVTTVLVAVVFDGKSLRHCCPPWWCPSPPPCQIILPSLRPPAWDQRTASTSTMSACHWRTWNLFLANQVPSLVISMSPRNSPELCRTTVMSFFIPVSLLPYHTIIRAARTGSADRHNSHRRGHAAGGPHPGQPGRERLHLTQGPGEEPRIAAVRLDAALCRHVPAEPSLARPAPAASPQGVTIDHLSDSEHLHLLVSLSYHRMGDEHAA